MHVKQSDSIAYMSLIILLLGGVALGIAIAGCSTATAADSGPTYYKQNTLVLSFTDGDLRVSADGKEVHFWNATSDGNWLAIDIGDVIFERAAKEIIAADGTVAKTKWKAEKRGSLWAVTGKKE